MHLFHHVWKLIFYLSFLLISFAALAQENCFDGIDNDGDGLIDLNDPDGCDCAVEIELEFLENGDFESFSVCPNGFSQLPVVDGFYFSQGGSTDFYHTCGYLGGGLYPEVSALFGPENGNGIVGLFSDPTVQYRELVSSCLNGTLISGEVYTLSFDLSTTGQFDTGELGSIPFIECSDFPFELYGSTACPVNLGNNDYIGCISNYNSEYISLIEGIVAIEVNQFNNYTFEFMVPQAINNIAFGGSCTDPSCSGPGANAYFYLDNLSITQMIEEEIDAPEISVAGNSCEGYVLTVNEPIYNGYQWFLDGVALQNETSTSLAIQSDETLNVVLGVFDEVNGESTCAFSAPLVLNPEAEIELSATFPEVLCEEELGVINLNISPQNNYAIEWNTGETSASIEAGIGNYEVFVSNTDTGCTASLSLEILTCESPPLQVELKDVTICEGEAARIEATVFGGVPPYSFEWTPDLGNSAGPFNIVATENSTYSMNVVDAEGNSSTATSSLEVLACDCNIYVPNAFTPDEDGLNEVFKVSIDCDIDAYDLRIFNRWGIEVFSSNNPNEAWLGGFDDYHNGNTVYNYILKVQKANDERLAAPIIRRGSITVVR